MSDPKKKQQQSCPLLVKPVNPPRVAARRGPRATVDSGNSAAPGPIGSEAHTVIRTDDLVSLWNILLRYAP